MPAVTFRPSAYIKDVEPSPVTFHDLYQRHAPSVYRYLLALTKDSAEADDLTAETFARCWTEFDRVEMPTVKAYLFAIARNLFLQHLRRWNRRADLDPELEDHANLAATVEQKTELEAAWRQLSSLPAVDREIFQLRVLYDLSYDEIARLHGITVSAAKVKVHRARLKLIRWRAQQENP